MKGTCAAFLLTSTAAFLVLLFLENGEAKASTSTYPWYKGANFTNNQTGKQKFACWACAGQKSPIRVDLGEGALCRDFRAFQRTFKKDWKKKVEVTAWVRTCEFDEECYSFNAKDKRILGFEEKGCGSGPKALPAEPYEGCEEGPVNNAGEAVTMINCVCDKELCNDAPNLHKKTGLFLLTFFVLFAKAVFF